MIPWKQYFDFGQSLFKKCQNLNKGTQGEKYLKGEDSLSRPLSPPELTSHTVDKLTVTPRISKLAADKRQL